MDDWQLARELLRLRPTLEASIGGDDSLHVERYLIKQFELRAPGTMHAALITMLGGSRVREGRQGKWRSSAMPSRSMLVPPGCATHWHYSGATDFAIFYFTSSRHGIQQRLTALASRRGEPIAFGDALVGATALQLMRELQRPAPDRAYVELLGKVLLEQTHRALTLVPAAALNPGHIHLARMQAVLTLVHQDLAGDLSVDALAAHAGISRAHFRRVFEEATGTSPHRYVLSARLEEARNLLAVTNLPIAAVAQECGFSSQSHLTHRFRAAHGTTPADYRMKARRAARPAN